jgi:hypothetical protein
VNVKYDDASMNWPWAQEEPADPWDKLKLNHDALTKNTLAYKYFRQRRMQWLNMLYLMWKGCRANGK